MGKKIIKKRFEANNSINIVLRILLSSLIGVSVSLLLSIIFSYILSKSPEINDFITIYFIISVLSGAFVCGFTGYMLLRFRGIVSGLICSFPYLLIILSIMLIASDGILSVISLLLYLFIVFFSLIGGIVSSNMKRRK
jgi:putative membrane protein (TIGR04086 family)